jgi:outer membrane protein assembly factor BamB
MTELSLPISRQSTGRFGANAYKAAALALTLVLASCGGDDDEVVIEGERISVMKLEDQLVVDPVLRNTRVSLPRPYVNTDWPHAGGSETHAMHHVALGQSPQPMWRTSVGAGSDDNERIQAQPVVANGRIFTMDSNWHISAIDANSGRVIWRVALKDGDEKKSSASGGGIGYRNGTLYVTMGSGFAAALDADSGIQQWRTDFDVALRGSPAMDDRHVYVTTHDSQFYALGLNDGSIQWQHTAITEAAALMGASTPAVKDDIVVAAFSSGELFALQSRNGHILWADSLTRTGRATPISTLNDIDGHPVIDRGRVFAVGHSGRMASIDLRTGQRVWENNIASSQTPWVAGDYVYVLTADNEVVCLSRETGKIRWLQELQRYEDNDKNDDLIIWTGPVLAGDRLLLVSNHGFAVSLSPYDGAYLGGVDMPKRNYISPVVANGVLYILSDNGDLHALR